MSENVKASFNPLDYYRLPWSLTDNGLTWFEITSQCNLACEGCYHENILNGHKSLVEIAQELEVYKKLRKSDSMSIAGGEPLVHPDIVEIVRLVKKGGWKPIVNTNGLAMTPELLHELKKAGVFGFTFHVDTTQRRKDSDAKAEPDHNALRQKFAEMVAHEGGICCSFNQTVSAETLDQVPGVIRWAAKYPDMVNSMVFILFRSPEMSGQFKFEAKGESADLSTIYSTTSWGKGRNITASDLIEKIREVEPLYEPCAYLNGTVDPTQMKWTLGERFATRSKCFGFASPKFMEVVQTFNHLAKGRWLSYGDPLMLGLGRSAMLFFGLFDSKMRKAAWRFLKSPSQWFRTTYIQTFAIIHPVDVLADGRMDMCEGCPDMTAHNGKLYWSCRLEEVKKFGTFVSAVPKDAKKKETVGV